MGHEVEGKRQRVVLGEEGVQGVAGRRLGPTRRGEGLVESILLLLLLLHVLQPLQQLFIPIDQFFLLVLHFKLRGVLLVKPRV